MPNHRVSAVLFFVTMACGGSPPPMTQPTSATSPALQECRPCVEDASADSENEEASLADEPQEGPSLSVEFRERADGIVGTFRTSGGDLSIVMRLGDRVIEAQVERQKFENSQSGNGAMFALDTVPIAAGTLVIVHHNLDAYVDPPRFASSRWSEGWWFPARMRSGDAVTQVFLRGQQFLQGNVHEQDSICVTDALGNPELYVAQGDTLVLSETADACVRVVAPQPEPVFVRSGERWSTTGDDYLAIEHSRRLGSGLYAVRAAWSDGGQYEEGEDVPAYRSTRLLVTDASGAVQWYYLHTTAFCDARRSADAIVCGARRFRLENARLIATR